MNQVVDQYWPRALKIAREYEIGQVNFADLTGLSEEFAASFIEQLNTMPEALRATQCAGLEAKLTEGINSNGADSNIGQAFSELLVSINRTPIY